METFVKGNACMLRVKLQTLRTQNLEFWEMVHLSPGISPGDGERASLPGHVPEPSKTQPRHCRLKARAW